MTAPIDVEKMKWEEFRESEEIRFRVKTLSSSREAHIGVEICEVRFSEGEYMRFRPRKGASTCSGIRPTGPVAI
jgi:hypothetical protein